MLACIIGAIVIFANSKKTIPGEYLTYIHIQQPNTTETDPISVVLGLGLAAQGITIAVLFTVVAGIAENVFFVRKKIEESKKDG